MTNWFSGAMDLPSGDHTVYDAGRVVARCGYCPGVARVREDGLPPSIEHEGDCSARRWCPAEYLADDGGDDPDQLAEALALRHRY